MSLFTESHGQGGATAGSGFTAACIQSLYSLCCEADQSPGRSGLPSSWSPILSMDLPACQRPWLEPGDTPPWLSAFPPCLPPWGCEFSGEHTDFLDKGPMQSSTFLIAGCHQLWGVTRRVYASFLRTWQGPHHPEFGGEEGERQVGTVERSQLPTSLLKRACSGSNVAPDIHAIFLLGIYRNT